MTDTIVRSQAELDAALTTADGSRIIIDSPGGAWPRLEVRGSSHVVAWDSAHVVARGSSHVVAWGSSHVEAWDSAHVEAWDSSHVEARDSSHVVATPYVAIHLHSAAATTTGGVIIDLATLDLCDVDTWRAYVDADALISPERDHIRASRVSSQGHPGEMGRDGVTHIGCFHGTPAHLREVIEGDDWPSGANAETRDRHRPRILAWAALCEQQLAAWAEAQRW